MNFNRRDVLKTGLLAGAACCVKRILLADDAIPVRERVFNEAQRIVNNTRHTKYQHDQFIDEATGTYDVDCSGYVSYALSRVAKRHLAMIPKEVFWPVPRAFKYYEYFATLPADAIHGWRQIGKLEDARRGDIIAWKLAGEVRKDHDTGHVFIVAETPSSAGGQLLAVRAFDSAAIKHYDDTRTGSETGVGEGTFYLRVDANGNPSAFQFGPGDNFHEDPIAIGRAV